MATAPGTLRVGPYLSALIVLLGLLYLVTFFPGQRHTPKLGIDLAGGKRVIFAARTGNGTTPTSDSMSQARQIIEDRINSTGVTNATVQVQGTDQLVVTIPGGTNTDVAALGEPAILNFRGVMAPAQVVSCGSRAAASSPSASSSASPSPAGSSASTKPSATKTHPQSGKSGTASSAAAGNAAAERPLAKAPSTHARTSTTPSRAASGSASPSGSATAPATAATSPGAAGTTKCLSNPIAELFKSDPGLKKVMPNAESCPSPALTSGVACHAFSDLSTTRQTELAAALRDYKCSAAQGEPDKADRYYIACDDGKQVGAKVAYLMGHVVVPGQEISGATAQAPGSNGQTTTANWSINLTLTGSGGDKWNAWTSKYHTNSTEANTASAIQTSTTAPCGKTAALPCSTFVAFTLNGQVISAPITTAVLDTQTQISGNYTQSSADELTRELNYGKLPLSFKTQSNESVSATLGSVQLRAAFLAGGIGLVLVVLYSLLYYRGLGVVTIASLLVSAAFTYAMLVILGVHLGYTLDLAGIAGFIVALGITADSFVVFFERIKDEVHEGRSMRVAVPRAWIRARRTILSADTVSFLAAAVLYYFAAADVKGFAFTLGLSTILDLVVVFLFTHPIVSLLSRSRAFGSPRFTGLNSVRTTGMPVDDELPAARPRRSARTAGATRSRRAGTVVLDKTDTETEEDVDLPVDEPDLVPEATARDETAPPDTEGRDDETRPARRRGAPQGGTAAERAAARRARIRAQRDEEGDA